MTRDSRGSVHGQMEVDGVKRGPNRQRKVRFVTHDDLVKHAAEDAEEDVAPLRRAEIERRDLEKLSSVERYRLEELQSVSKQLKSFYGLDFELDHASALLNKAAPGAHHPNNLQFLLKLHNGKKRNSNWPRFTLEEQLEYIRASVQLQKLVMDRLELDNQTEVMEALLNRIAQIYEEAE